MAHVEKMFLTGTVPYPIEGTLVTTGLVTTGMRRRRTWPSATRDHASTCLRTTDARLCYTDSKPRGTACELPPCDARECAWEWLEEVQIAAACSC
jgi:hypothetical protein